MNTLPLDEQDFFRITDEADPHCKRRRLILQAHPEIRKLFGPNRWSALLIVVLVAAQTGLGVLTIKLPWWAGLILAYGVGACLAASLNALIHDASHGLVFKDRPANRWIAMLANLPLVFVSAEPFRRYHPAHHYKMGDYNQDVGIPTEWEAQWVGGSPWRKGVWLAFFSVFQLFRTAKYADPRPYVNRWFLVNLLLQLLYNTLLFIWAGPWVLLYLGLSQLFAFGLHPLGARVIQEHVMVREGQETYSCTGPFAWLECNFGYHNEHHDFPGIPWNRLPQVTAAAPEFYDSLFSYKSRWTVLRRFILDRRVNLFCHTVRN